MIETSILDVLCVRCHHRVVEHGAVGDRPDIDPEFMPCETPGCECVDFHFCDRPDCTECVRL
jgi:hypothetical protein